MTLTQINELNMKFQNSAVQLSELIPTGGFRDAISIVMRSSRMIHEQFLKLIKVSDELNFNQLMDKLEEELDEVIFILDQLELANKKRDLSVVNDFLEEGYSLLSIYSKGIDYVIEQRVKNDQ